MGSPLEYEALDYFVHNAGSVNGPITSGVVVFAGGNESAPAQEPKPEEALRQREDYLRIQPNGTIKFDNDSETTAVYVCSLTGERIRIATHADYIDVSMLPAGYYKLVKTLKGNRQKTIGVFMK